MLTHGWSAPTKASVTAQLAIATALKVLLVSLASASTAQTIAMDAGNVFLLSYSLKKLVASIQFRGTPIRFWGVCVMLVGEVLIAACRNVPPKTMSWAPLGTRRGEIARVGARVTTIAEFAPALLGFTGWLVKRRVCCFKEMTFNFWELWRWRCVSYSLSPHYFSFGCLSFFG